MQGSDYRSLMTVIDSLYAAAIEPSRWPRFLSSMTSMFEADNAFVSQIDHQARVGYFGLPQQPRNAAARTFRGSDRLRSALAELSCQASPAGALPNGGGDGATASVAHLPGIPQSAQH